MAEKLKYVSPEYQAQLDKLSNSLVTPERFGEVALQGVLFELDDTVEFDPIED